MKNNIPTKSGIYQWRNLIDGRIYVGSALNFRQRNYSHTSDLNRNNHKNQYLQNAWNKYGKENFVFEILEYCASTFLLGREQYYINSLEVMYYQKGYNIAPQAGSNYGLKFSEKGRENVSKGRIGNKNRLGIPHTEDAKKLISEKTTGLPSALKGTKLSEEHKEKISRHLEGNQYAKGYKHSDETREKLRQAAKNRDPGKEALRRERLSLATKGKPWSAARRAAHENKNR
ncbi:MAG TPA: GIY-YIG nuclease family protein [Aquella sp.]|nr:GIY-YIG nuclease family protein [Aquella sp.]